MLINRSFIILLVVGCLSILASGQDISWSEPVPISDESLVCRRPEVISYNNEICVAYYEQGNSPDYCYFSKGTDCGDIWGNPFVLSDSSDYNGSMPNIIRVGDTLHVVWRGFLPLENPQVFYRRSPDLGETWEDVQQITRSYIYMKYPDISEINGKLICLYNAMFQPDTVFIMAVTSDDGGRNWDEPYRVRYNIASTNSMKLLENNGRLYLIYMAPGVARIEVVYICSDDEGFTWTEPVYLSSDDQYASQAPQAYIDETGLLSVCWMDYKYGSNGGINGDILMNYSNDNGDTWSGEVRVTNKQSSRESAIQSDESYIYVAYDDIRDGNENIYFRSSSDLGITWSDEEQLTSGVELESIDPSLAISYCDQIKTIHLVWSQQYEQGERVITYSHKENQTSIDENTTLPEKTAIDDVSIFPNPFNSNTMIQFKLNNDTYTKICIYNVLGEKVAELFEGYLLSGINQISLSSYDCNLASGYYYISITGNGERIIKPAVLLK